MTRKIFSPLAMMLISTLACIVPGLGAPAPVSLDPAMLPTIVVLTANAAIAQTAAVQPLATDLPAAGLTGATVEHAQDGTTKYADHDGGFEVIFPVGWLAVRPNSDEFNAAQANEGAANTMLRDQMTNDMARYEANYDRLYAYVLRPDIEQNVILGFSKLVWDSEDTTLLDNTAMGELVRGLESSGAIPGFRADTVQLRENVNAVTLIEIGGRFAMSDGLGGTVPFYSTLVLFKPTVNSTVRLTFTFLQEYNVQVSTDVKSVIESIRMPGP